MVNDIDSLEAEDGNGSGQTVGLDMLARLEHVMHRVEAKLTNADHMENRCQQLEDRCTTLESLLQRATSSMEGAVKSVAEHVQSVDTKVDDIKKSLKYHEMLMKNQKTWEYTENIPHPDCVPNTLSREFWQRRYQFDPVDSRAMASFCQRMKKITESMRWGEDADEIGTVEITATDVGHGPLPHHHDLMPHWRELCNALEQYSPVLEQRSGYEHLSQFTVFHVQISPQVWQLLTPALTVVPFEKLVFQNNEFGRSEFAEVFDLFLMCPHLKHIHLCDNQIEDMEDITNLCQVIENHPSIEQVSIINCFPNNGFDALRSIIGVSNKLTHLGLSLNGIDTGRSAIVADFLAANPRLESLYLIHNRLNNDNAASIARALHTNNNLKVLNLDGNDITDLGRDQLQLALCNETSLDTVANCNHTCSISLCSGYNSTSDPKVNRAGKVYELLVSLGSNITQDFNDIPAQLLPNILDCVQTCLVRGWGGSGSEVLTIMNEIMHWEKAIDMIKLLSTQQEMPSRE